jgi:hypothetical protein
MIPVRFPQANVAFKHPEGLDESQVRTVMAYTGPVVGGSVDGETMVVVAWQPDPMDLVRLQAGAPVYLTTLGGLPPHFLTTDFDTATHPA